MKWFGLMTYGLVFASVLRTDELIFRYEGDASPATLSPEWVTGNPCDAACSEFVESGHLIFYWPRDPSSGDRFVNYTHIIGVPPNVPEPPLWVEWRFASNNAIHISTTNDGTFVIGYGGVFDLVDMYGDAVIRWGDSPASFNLPLNEFRTLRFETTSAHEYCFWIDGGLFFCDPNKSVDLGQAYIQLYGHGGVDGIQGPGPIINRWDYVRYGRGTTGEVIVASDPPGGVLDATQYPNLDRFTITFDQSNYVFVNDVSVEIFPYQGRNTMNDQSGNPKMLIAGDIPTVIATRRQNNGPPETVEIVLDRPLAINTTTRFTLNTGGTPNTVEYTLLESQPCCFPSGLCTEVVDCISEGGSLSSSPCEGDTDLDGLDAACGDACPSDPVKVAPGQCGCGVPDTDTDSDTIPDCVDQCEDEDDRIDANANGTPDCLESTDIPAASAWSLAILALLLSITAKIAYSSRLRALR